VHRYHIEAELKPDFKLRQSWYNTPFIKMNGGHLTYGTQRQSIIDAFENFDLNCSKKTHLGRDVAVAVGAKAGLSESSMKRQGIIFLIYFRTVEPRLISGCLPM